MTPHHNTHFVLKIALGAVIVALAILGILLFQQYGRIQQLDYIAAHRQSLLRALRGSGPLTAANASSTQAWMTFDYIDRAFALPPDYIKGALSITDSRYPRLTIEEYAEDAKIPAANALEQVREAISSYFKAQQ